MSASVWEAQQVRQYVNRVRTDTTAVTAAGSWSIYRWSWHFSGSQALDEAYPPFFSALAPAGDDAMVARCRWGLRSVPWFLVREHAAWRLDLAASQHALRFNHHNEWRLAGATDDYHFAFEDWRFRPANLIVSWRRGVRRFPRRPGPAHR